ncbi:MAG: hypothetical protein WC650_04545 [Candidatus Doudnabacteria bacterium]
MKKGILIGIMLLIFAGNLLASDALRLKDTLGQPGMLWEWDHNNKYWSGYIASSSEPSWTTIAAGPSAKFGKWFAILYGGLTLDQTNPKLGPKAGIVESFNAIGLCKQTVLKFDAFLTLPRTGKGKINLACWLHLLERVGPHFIGGQITLYKEARVTRWALGPRVEYFFSPWVKVVIMPLVNPQSPHAKSCLVDLWVFF